MCLICQDLWSEREKEAAVGKEWRKERTRGKAAEYQRGGRTLSYSNMVRHQMSWKGLLFGSGSRP